MIVYNVTVNIDADVHDEWLAWMVDEHIPKVLATGLFIDSRMSKMLLEEEGGGITYSIQYTLESMDKMQEYEEKFATDLRNETLVKYDGKFGAFRTMMEVVAIHQA